MKKIGVGIVGASPLQHGWAVLAHIPALQALPQYSIRAVSTSRRQSAEAARNAFQVDAYDNHLDLLRRDDVDLVVVSVKVPGHYELVSDSLNAGKMVYCEWPLGVDTAQAVDMEAKARKAGVRTVVGLQGRFAPAIQHARRLIQNGHIGDVLSATLIGSGISWGAVTTHHQAYLFDEANGATTLTVPMMHALDCLAHMVGEFETIQAISAIRRPFVKNADDGSDIPVTAPDQVSVSGRLASGAIASVFYRGGLSRAGNLYWQINGSKGDLAFSSAMGNVQVAELRLRGGSGADAGAADIIPPDELKTSLPSLPAGFGSNIARLYFQFARDLEEGTQVAPDFAYAVRRHRLIDSIRAACKLPGVAVGEGAEPARPAR